MTVTQVDHDVVHALARPGRTLDVWSGCTHTLTRAEEAVIASPPFQRLRRLRQMGLAFHAWPNAENTRASHSLGVAYWAATYLDALRRADDPATRAGLAAADAAAQAEGVSLDLVVRLFALVHDIELLPLGHTLRYQSGLFGEAAGQPRRAACLAAIKAHAAVQADADADPDRHAWLAAFSRHLDAATDPSNWLAVELVNSGLGADLVDFALRDSFAITRPQAFPRDLPGGLRLVETDRGWGLALDISDGANARARVAIADDLYRARFEVFASSVFHPVKLAADAMLDLVLRRLGPDACRALLPEDDLLALGDDELLDRLAGAEAGAVAAGPPGPEPVGAALRAGRLHEEVWRTDDLAAFQGRPDRDSAHALALDPGWRTEAEASLRARLPWAADGDVIVAVSPPTMQAKPADARLVGPGGDVFSLAEASAHGFDTEAEATSRRYQGLWSLRVYLARRCQDDARREAAAAAAGAVFG